jgi:lipopolysaccharide export system permease protein
MRIIDRYLRRAVLTGTLIAMGVLLPLVAFLLLADELDNVGVGHYTLADAFTIIGLSLPRYAYQIFPIGALIGSLLGLGSLAAHEELTAMRAAGVAVSRISWSILKAGLVLAVIGVVVGEVVAPASEEKASTLRASLLSERIVLKSRYGFWARDGNAFINIREILPGGRLRDLYIYELGNDRRLKLSTYAAFAFYTGHAWQLRQIRQSALGDQGVTVRSAPEAVWTSLLDPGMLSLLVVDPHVLPVWTLYRYIRFMEDNGLNATSYLVTFWGKVATPLVSLVMIFLAVPLLFGSLRSVGVGQRVFIGVLAGIAFYILDKASSQLSVVYSVDPLLAALLPGLMCLGVTLLLFRRVH